MPQSGVETPSYYFESLGYLVPDRHMDPYYAEFVPRLEDVEPKPHIHPGFEFLYILEGELSLRHGDSTTTLTTGDAAYFDAGTPHSYQCVGKRPSGAIIVTMHQAPNSQPQPLRAVAVPGQRPVPIGAAKPTGTV